MQRPWRWSRLSSSSCQRRPDAIVVALMMGRITPGDFSALLPELRSDTYIPGTHGKRICITTHFETVRCSAITPLR
jgi:hypothetical protein